MTPEHLHVITLLVAILLGVLSGMPLGYMLGLSSGGEQMIEEVLSTSPLSLRVRAPTASRAALVAKSAYSGKVFSVVQIGPGVWKLTES